MRCSPALLAGLAACSSPSEETEAALASGPLVLQTWDARLPSFQAPAFQALGALVADGDDEMARALLDRILARAPAGEARERALAYDRILRGRALVRTLELSLRMETVESGHRRVMLDAVQRSGGKLTLRLLPGTLEHRRTGVDVSGVQRTELDTRTIERVEEIVLRPGEVKSVSLGRDPLQMGTLLALRERWRLFLRSGEVWQGGKAYPASNIPVSACEAEHLAEFLVPDPVEPAQLVEIFEDGEEVQLLDFLATCVRVDPERREEALAALEPVLLEWLADETHRREVVQPALEWLLVDGRGGAGAEDWIQEEARKRASRTRDESRPRLELPGAGEEER